MDRLAQPTQAVEEKVDSGIDPEPASWRGPMSPWHAWTSPGRAPTSPWCVLTKPSSVLSVWSSTTCRRAPGPVRKAARERRERNQRWGELANKMGTVVEDIVAPSVRRLAREVFDCGDLVYFGTRQTVTREDDRSRRREFDALYVGTRAVLLNQTRSSPRSADACAVRGFFKRSGEFAKYYPLCRELLIVPGFASLNTPEEMVRYLTRHGIYALAMGDEAMQVLNLEAVRNRQAAP